MGLPPGRTSLVDTATAVRLFARLGHWPRELAAAAYLDPNWTILGMRHAAGTRASVTLPIREIARDALRLGAVAVAIAHGHPDGDPEPSPDDLAFTRALSATLAAIDVTLADHVILAGDRWCSLRAGGMV